MVKDDVFTCIVCPKGCTLTVNIDNELIKVSGNECARGELYAKQELLNPMRSLCTSVKTMYEDFPRLSVRTKGDIPKSKIFEAMKEINKVLVKQRLNSGDLVLQNLLNTGIDVIATDTMELQS